MLRTATPRAAGKFGRGAPADPQGRAVTPQSQDSRKGDSSDEQAAPCASREDGEGQGALTEGRHGSALEAPLDEAEGPVRCPKCDSAQTYVVKTLTPIDKMVESLKQRRRVCRDCRDRFTTFEIGEDEFNALCKLIQEQGPVRRRLRTRPLSERRT